MNCFHPARPLLSSPRYSASMTPFPIPVKETIRTCGILIKKVGAGFLFSFFNFSLRSDPNILVIFLSGEFSFSGTVNLFLEQSTMDRNSLAAGLLQS